MRLTICLLICTFLIFNTHAQTFKISKEHGNKYALFDEEETQLTDYKYDIVTDFFEGKAAVSKNGYWGYVNSNGKEIIKCKYFETHYFSEGLCPVNLKGVWIYLNEKGKMPFKKNYQYAFPFSEGLAAVKLNDKWGFINRQGEFVIPPKFESAYSFSGGLAAVRHERFWGYISSRGQVVIDFNFDQAGPFKNNEATVMINSRQFQIDKQGKPLKETKAPDKEEEIYKIVEKMPAFPGGYDKLFEYLEQNIKYPASEKEGGIKGEVIVKILVKKDGSIVNPKIVKGLTTSCDVEALRLIKNMPKWTPGMHKGQAVDVQLQIPIKFE